MASKYQIMKRLAFQLKQHDIISNSEYRMIDWVMSLTELTIRENKTPTEMVSAVIATKDKLVRDKLTNQ